MRTGWGFKTGRTQAALAVVVLVGGGIYARPDLLDRGAPVRVGYFDFRPYMLSDAEGKPEGFAVDVIKEAASRARVDVEWIAVSDADQAIARSQIDLIPMLTSSGAMDGELLFSEYWWQSEMVLVSAQRNTERSRIKRLGFRSSAFVEALAKGMFPAAELDRQASQADLVRKLCAGRLDAVLVDESSLGPVAAESTEECHLEPVRQARASVPLSTASRRVLGRRAVRMDAAIVDMLLDGTVEQLAHRYALSVPSSNQQLVRFLKNRRLTKAFQTVSGISVATSLLLLFAAALMRRERLATQRIQLALRESEQRFHAFMDNSPALGTMKDRQGRLVYASRAYYKAFSTTPEEVLGTTGLDRFSEEVARQIQANDRQVIESGMRANFLESTGDRADGSRIHWLSSKFPFASQSGESFLGCVSIDITQMAEAQEGLRESESRYRQIVEFAGDVIVRCDAAGKITYVNETAVRLLKWNTAELQGRDAFRLIRRDRRAAAIREFRRCLGAQVADVYLETPVITKDGREIWLGQIVRRLGNKGVVTGFQAISRDITARKRIENELKASEERFRTLYENGPVAYHEVDREGIIQRVNRAECELLGIPAEELVGRSVIDLLTPEDREAAALAIRSKVRGDVTLQPFTRTVLSRDGRRIRVEIHENLLRDDSGQVVGLHSVLLDVTQRYLAETMERDRSEITERILKQEPLNDILGAVAAMVHHPDNTLVCIPMRREGKRLEPVVAAYHQRGLQRMLGVLAEEGNRLWPPTTTEASFQAIADWLTVPGRTVLAQDLVREGLKSCWAVPILSSGQGCLGTLLVFSPRSGEPSLQERHLIESASRLAGIAMEHRYMNDMLSFQAGHDALTGLPNRARFESRLKHEILQARNSLFHLAIFYVDLDRFKEVNDRFGHSVGDDLLRQVAKRLNRCIRHSDMAARIGGDEFTILLTGLRQPSEANRVAEAILRAFQSPFRIDERELEVTPSIGISFFPQDGDDAESLQRNSDIAMYRAKSLGKNSYQYFRNEDEGKVLVTRDPLSGLTH